MENREYLINYIKEKLVEFKELGKEYSDEKIYKLVDKLLGTNKTLEEITMLIDNKFSRQLRKINHNKQLTSLKEYYISSIDKLKKGNNYYLLSYDQGIKILEQASIEEEKEIEKGITQVKIGKNKKGHKKINSTNNDYELISSDIAYLLDIPYAKTYRMFDSEMNPCGILNESFVYENERFLTLEETLQYIKEESPSFILKSELQEYHDRNVKKGIRRTKDTKEIKDNIEYVFKIFKALPDITDKNYNDLKTTYLNIKLFELLTNSLDNTLDNIGIIVNKSKKKYTYKIAPIYNKCSTKIDKLHNNECICNFYIVDKKDLTHIIISNYYKYVKVLASLIVDNKKKLTSIINQLIKEHLDFESYDEYQKLIENNIEMITEDLLLKKLVSPDNEEDDKVYNENNEKFIERIKPYIERVKIDEILDERGSTALVIVVGTVLVITIVLVLLAIIAISKVEM